MALAGIAASVRADACEQRRISIAGLSPVDTETISLLFEILGWRLVPAGPIACSARSASGARLSVTRQGAIIHVDTDDPDLAQQLATNGLDRLVPPLNIAALEQLSMFAG